MPLHVDAVLVVVLVLVAAVGAVAYSLYHTRDDVEPTVREFAEFRDAIVGREYRSIWSRADAAHAEGD